MERDSFIFYKSFYDAVADLPKDIKLEVLTAIIEYALYGRQPENLKPFAQGMFTLVKPNIDVNNTRLRNGKHGGRPKKQPVSPVPAYTLTYEQEVERMRSDEKWRKSICEDFSITPREYGIRLTRFLDHCNTDKTHKGRAHHDSFADCQSHLRYWMAKAYPQASLSPHAAPSPSLSVPDDFGAANYDD